MYFSITLKYLLNMVMHLFLLNQNYYLKQTECYTVSRTY